MDIFGIGIPEAIFFLLIMLIILGPTDMVKWGRTLGTSLRKLMTSPTWRMIFSTSNTLRNLPNALAREAGVEELRQELKRETESIKKMGKELTEATQFNLPPITPFSDSPKPTPQPNPPSPKQTDFSAWTTPVDPPPDAETTNSILPPHLSKTPPSDAESRPTPPNESSSVPD